MLHLSPSRDGGPSVTAKPKMSRCSSWRWVVLPHGWSFPRSDLRLDFTSIWEISTQRHDLSPPSSRGPPAPSARPLRTRRSPAPAPPARMAPWM
ncbi:hypothetical protein AV530_015744 [Patagioenas fasciata monilis]|uniref:Uncharacterized protein n=1 Tax=Patagioenas fasciata monilis TaxID=372326 RepID=A0A1V4KII8_PATFA|nr:hypothetical protein AV530_015744 [Patagioenas fasciata monilis]